MFGLGPGELIIILAIALLVLGPARLPDVATSLGKAIRSFRKATRDLTDQLEIDEEVKAPLRELQSALRDEPASQQLAVMKGPVTPAAAGGIAPTPVAASDNIASGTAAPPLVDTPPLSVPAPTPPVAAAAADKKA
jgi:TatA/E family protein of Tat protein translocase